jgi:hypothetical protein
LLPGIRSSSLDAHAAKIQPFRRNSSAYIADGYLVYNTVVLGGPIAAFWENGTVTDLTNYSSHGDLAAVSEANGIAVSGSDVYVAGWQYVPIEVAPGDYIYGQAAALWKNGVVTDLTDGTWQADALGVTVSNSGDVYVVGWTTNTTTGNIVATYWKNGVATYLDDGTTTNSAASAITVSSSGDVYVVGLASESPTTSGVATIWKNGVATNLSDGNGTGTPNAIAVTSSGDVFIAGSTITSTTIFGTVWENGTATNLPGETVYDSPWSIFVTEQ